jgi:hypothetical protein
MGAQINQFCAASSPNGVSASRQKRAFVSSAGDA